MAFVPNIDLAQVFRAADTARAGRSQEALRSAQLQQIQGQQQQQSQLAQLQQQQGQALGQAVGGDPTQLQQQFPERFLQFQQEQTQQGLREQQLTQAQQTTAVTGLETERRKGLLEAQTFRRAIGEVQKNPAAIGEIRNRFPGANLPDKLSPAQADDLADKLDTQIKAFGQPELTPKLQEIAIAKGLNPNDPTIGDNPVFQQAVDEFLGKTGGGININVDTGRAEITKQTRAKAEEEIKKGSDTLKILGGLQDILASPDAEDFFTLTGRGGIALDVLQEKSGLGTLTPQEKRVIKTQQDLRRGSTQVTTAFRKEVTGAAASEKEDLRMIPMMLDPSQSFTQFQTNLNAITQRQEDIITSRKELLREGIDVNDPRFEEAQNRKLAEKGPSLRQLAQEQGLQTGGQQQPQPQVGQPQGALPQQPGAQLQPQQAATAQQAAAQLIQQNPGISAQETAAQLQQMGVLDTAQVQEAMRRLNERIQQRATQAPPQSRRDQLRERLRGQGALFQTPAELQRIVQ